MTTFIHIPVEGDIEEIIVQGDDTMAYNAIKAALSDGWLELMPNTINHKMAMMVDEEGRRKQLPVNPRATALQSRDMGGNIILGGAVLISRDGPELGSCPLSVAEVIALVPVSV